MTDNNARQAGITEALHYLQMGIANLELGNGVHMIDFRNAERAILAAHSADARNEELWGVVRRLERGYDPKACAAELRALLTTPPTDARNGEGVALTDALRECIRVLESAKLLCNWPEMHLAISNALSQGSAALLAAPAAPAPRLQVWYGPMPESNGKSNFTAILHAGRLHEGHTIDRSEYPERVRYAADRVRYLIGDLDKKPYILDYDADKHSGYVAPAPAAQADEWIRKAQAMMNVAGDNTLRVPPETMIALLRQQSATPAAPAVNESALTQAVWQRICELPDRNSPEGEPDACVLNLREFSGCMANALEDLNLLPPQGISPADAASEADKRDAYAAGLQRAETICREQKYMALQPMRTFSAEDVLQANRQTAKHLADLIQYERQQGAQSNG